MGLGEEIGKGLIRIETDDSTLPKQREGDCSNQSFSEKRILHLSPNPRGISFSP